jgi:hypothetical protein
MKSRGWLFSLLLDQARQVEGSVKHLKRMGGKSDVAILVVPMW